ncbi:glycosyltransferase family 1 protein [Putridiphycobacter roseus]|uniref:Glycosyltransferase family 1 protein n=1 Tax=Putridiphycobacter roseus TaxID=2219161 RepID=A0A2W1N0B3_9FLAO|nr:glycosyltransferase family 4 protein [Putridiphycobacter roseus]PZE17647.1 glycosyltransferase family 1 protein [Putridiphycobacter roseus]
MNILFLTDGITPYVTGGMQKHSMILVRLLLDRNIKVTLVHCGNTGASSFEENVAEQFTAAQNNLLHIQFIPFLAKGKLPGHYIIENKAYSKAIFHKYEAQLDQFDFVYAQGFTGWEFVNQPIQPKVLVNFHGFEMFQIAANPKVQLEHAMLRPVVKRLCKKADYVYSFGAKIDDILLKIGLAPQKILDQSNGIESKWIKPNISKNNLPLKFIFIGRNERRKGIEELTQALLNISNNNIFNFSFTFIGPIPPNKILTNKNVEYLGEIKNPHVIQEHLSNADVLLCPSYAEGMPTVILEAMANGLAIIGTDVGATAKMIQHNGLVIPDSSPESIQNAMVSMIQMPVEELTAFKKQSLKLVKEQFVWEKIADSIVHQLKGIQALN